MRRGLLHDVVEDSGLTIGEVTERFGPQVGELVAALTEDPSISDWEERKLALRERVADSGPECAAIYIADKLANLHDWRVVYAEVGERAVQFFKAPTLDARIRAWHADLEMGERIAAQLGLNARFRRELERFERERLGEPAPRVTDPWLIAIGRRRVGDVGSEIVSSAPMPRIAQDLIIS